MRKLLLCLSLLSVSLFANDRVGEWNQLLLSVGDQPSGYIQTAYIKHQSRNQSVRLETLTADLDGNVVNTEITDVADTEIWTPEKAVGIITNCTAIGGTLEDLFLLSQTVTACKMGTSTNILKNVVPSSLLSESGSGTVWLGPFPINGIAKFRNEGLGLDLAGYHWNL